MKILVLSEIKYSYLKTRKQQILSRFPGNWWILFLEPYKAGKPNNWTPKQASEWLRNCTVPFLKNFKGALKYLFRCSLARNLYFVFSGTWICSVLKEARFDDPDLVIISNLYAVPYLDFKCPIIYDMNDDHMAFENTPSWLVHHRDLLFAKASKIVVCSESLAELVPETYKRKVVYIGNGLDISAFISETNSAVLVSQELSRAKSE